MKDLFTHYDFHFDEKWKNEIAATEANHKLNALIKTWPVVWGSSHDGFIMVERWRKKPDLSDTHTARLAFIEEIKKEPCQHEPPRTLQFFKGFYNQFNCVHCGVELEVRWMVKE